VEGDHRVVGAAHVRSDCVAVATIEPESGVGRGRITRRPVVRRGAWTAADQALSSASNFGLGLVLARTLDRPEFGAYSLAFAAYVLLLGASRAVSSSVLQVRFTATPDKHNNAIRDSIGVPLILSVPASAALLLAAWVIGGTVGDGLAALALVLPALLMQDAWRFAFFMVGRARAAAANDLVWVVVQFSALGVLVARGDVTVSTAILAWGAGAYVASAFGCIQSGLFPRLKGALQWVRVHRDLGVPMLVEFLLISGTRPAVMLLLGAVVGTTEAGTLRAAEILLGPLNIFFTAAVLLAVPEAARLYGSTPDRLPRVLRIGGYSVAAVAILFGVVTLAIPTSLGEALVGPNWESARPVMAPLALEFAAVSVMTAWLAGLRVLEAVGASLAVRVGLTVAYLAAAAIGMLVSDAFGAVVGLALVSIVGAGVMQRVFTQRFASAQGGPART